MNRQEDTNGCSDLIVLGLPWKCDEEDVENYFKKFGDVALAQVKRDRHTQRSKGFGFIRFADPDAQERCLATRHQIDGRWCEVRNSKGDGERQGGGGGGQGQGRSQGGRQQSSGNRKIFVGRCTEDLTDDDLWEYFEQFGEVTDVFFPRPFRGFAFVTFGDPSVADQLVGDREDHTIKGANVHISIAKPKERDNRGGDYRGGRGGRGGGW